MKKFCCCILILCVSVHIFGQTVRNLQRFSGIYIFCERIYLQTDKHLYLAGEPILMKVLTKNTEQVPVSFSKIAYVELVDNSASRIQIKIELTYGVGDGIMHLPADIPTGYYRLIAYTSYMRNEGADVFFEKNIAVLNTFQSGYIPSETGALSQLSSPVSNDFEETAGRGLSLQPDRTSYDTRQRGELLLTGLPENIHTLSVSIAGKEIISIEESNVSLFQKNLTKKTTEFSDEFLPEYEGHIITGKIIDNQTENIVTDELYTAPALTIPGEKIRFFAGQKNNTTGEVRFFTSGISEKSQIATVMYFADDKYRIDIQSPFVSEHAPKQMPLLHVDSAYYRQLLERSVALQVFRYFADENPENYFVKESYFKMEPTLSYLLDEYTRFPTMREVFIEFIVGARFRRNAEKQDISVLMKRGDNYSFGTMPLVLLDGVPVSDHTAIYNYDPLTVERINIYYGPYIMGGYRFDGIVELITYRRLHQYLTLNRSTQVLSYESPQAPYHFYTPDYSIETNIKSRIPDGRHTLLWNPDVRTEGKSSIRIPFDTSDLTGEFQVTVEGITKNGEIVFVTSNFTVNACEEKHNFGF